MVDGRVRDFSSWQRNVFNLSQGEADFTLTVHYQKLDQLISAFEKLPKCTNQQVIKIPEGEAAGQEPGVGVRCR